MNQEINLKIDSNIWNSIKRFCVLFFGYFMIFWSVLLFLLNIMLTWENGGYILLIFLPFILVLAFIGYFLISITAKLIEIKGDNIILKAGWKKFILNKSEIALITRPKAQSYIFYSDKYPITIYIKHRHHGLFKRFAIFNEPTYDLIKIFHSRGIRIKEYILYKKSYDYYPD
jgi:hypothetical protein